MLTYMYRCDEHGIFAEYVEYRDRDEPQHCPECEKASPRTWEQSAPHVMQVALPDGTKRFDAIRTKTRLERARAHAKEHGDLESLGKVRKELDKLKGA